MKQLSIGRVFALLVLAMLLAACAGLPSAWDWGSRLSPQTIPFQRRDAGTGTPRVRGAGVLGKLPDPSNEPTIRFAVIGDYGNGSRAEEQVADLVKSWNPDFIITAGDNNYMDGEARTIDQNIGRYYGEFIYPYDGQSPPNRFFPTLGNHDWHTQDAQPYLDYFVLPGNERYYDFGWGPVDFFALDSDPHEPDGITETSAQATWLREKLADSTAPWKIVYMHHPPFSSGQHGSTSQLQWPYKEWGATAVIAGHDHSYERILRDGFPYFVNGLGGASGYPFGEAVSGSQVRYSTDHGAMLVEASSDRIVFRFYARSGDLVDEYTLTANSPGS
jgi:tartrate-resistant acid phosphatase type 5